MRGTDFKNWHTDRAKKAPARRVKKTSIERRKLIEGDIIIEISGGGPTQPVGRARLIDNQALESVEGDLLCSNFFRRLRLYCCLDSKYFALLINYLSEIGQLNEFQSQTTNIRNLNWSNFSTSPIIPFPPIAEQKRIVTKLDSLFAHTRRARQELDHIPKLIERYKQAILSAAFRGDLTTDWRKENNQIINAKKFLIDSGIMPCKDVELSPLPDTWIWALTGDLCNIKSGVALGKKRSLGTELIELPYLRVANVQKGWLNLSEIKTILVTQKEAELLYLQSGDILMNEGGDRDKLGRGHVWNGQIENCIHQNHVFRLRLKSQKISPFYISYYANELGQQYFIGQGKQTTNLASISMSKLSRFPVPVAPPEEMQVILQLIEKELKKIEILKQEVSKAYKFLDRLEQSTLAKAFRGEIVPQDPNDEPASILLERIQKERESQQKPKKRQLSLFKEK